MKSANVNRKQSSCTLCVFQLVSLSDVSCHMEYHMIHIPGNTESHSTVDMQEIKCTGYLQFHTFLCWMDTRKVRNFAKRMPYNEGRLQTSWDLVVLSLLVLVDLEV